MNSFRPLSAIEQLAAHLRGKIQSGALGGALPGVHRMAKELGVSPKTVVAAVALLEHEGVLQGQGARRRCRILPQPGRSSSGLRVAILQYEAADRLLPYILDLEHRLQTSGHLPAFAPKTLLDLGRDLKRVASLVGQQEADAWVVIGGSREILDWFSRQPVPAFALFGRRRGLPIAGGGPDKVPPTRQLVQRLVQLGHRRIVRLAREERRKPQPGALESAFLDELANQGITTGPYHLPDWEETPEGFKRCLDGLFRVTPPTALILDEALFLIVAQQHLARRGIVAPDRVSLICSDPDPSFEWFLPRVAHIRWDAGPVVRRIVRWVGNLAQGKADLRQSDTNAEFVEGGTIGPAAKDAGGDPA